MVNSKRAIAVPRSDQVGDPLPQFAAARLGTRRFRSPAPVRCLRISPGGEHVAMTLREEQVGSDNNVLIYDLTTGERVRTLSGHEHHVHSLDYSPNGEVLASTGLDATIRLWDAHTGAALRTLRGTFLMGGAVAFSDDNTLLTTHDDSTVRIWDLTTGHELLILEPADESGLPDVLAVSSDGLMVASAEIDDVLLWRLDEEEPVNILKGHEYGVWAISFFSNGETLASGSLDETVRFWDVRTCREVRRLGPQNGSICAMALSPDERTLAVGGDSSEVVLCDVFDGAVIARFGGHTGSIEQIAFSPDGKRLVTAGTGQTIRVWNLETGECSLPTFGHTHALTAITFVPNGAEIVTGSRDGTIRGWDPTSGVDRFAVPAHPGGVGRLAVARSGHRLASVEFGNDVNKSVGLAVWDLETRTQIGPTREQPSDVRALAFTSDDREIVTCTRRGTFRRWRVTGGDRPERKHGLQRQVDETATGPLGDVLAIHPFDGVLQIRDLKTLEGVGQFKTQTPRWVGKMAFSPDERLVAVAGADDVVAVLSLETGRRILELRGHTRPPLAVAWSPDGRWIASGGGDRTVRLWDAATGSELIVLTGHERPIEHVAFSPDGSKLASTSGETWALVWDIFEIKTSLGIDK